MTANQLFADIETGCLTEVPAATNSYYDRARGLTAHQVYYVYPDGTIVSLTHVDGSYLVTELNEDRAATFRHLYERV